MLRLSATVVSVVLLVVCVGYLIVVNIRGHNYLIQNNGEDVDNYPEVSWNDITSGKLGNFLYKLSGEGKMPGFAKEIIPVDSFRASGEGYYRKTSIKYVGLSDNIVESGRYMESVSRPYKSVAYYKTNIGNKVYYVVVQQWKNKDGSTSFILFVEPSDQAYKSNNFSDRYLSLVDRDRKLFLSPIMIYKDQVSCKIVTGLATEYCSWYFNKEKRITEFEKMLSNWLDSGMVPKNMVRYPVMFIRSSISAK